jgi:hypothetical protein
MFREYLFRPGSNTSCGLILSATLTFIAAPACAGECGDSSPDYVATRTISVGGATSTAIVSVSGAKVREEHSAGGHKMIVIDLFSSGIRYLIDPDRRQASRVPPPETRGGRAETRVVEEKSAGGATIRHAQFKSNDKWVDLSTTTCRSDGIMTHQTFYTMDPRGRLQSGKLSQTNIHVGSLPASLFELPSDITLTP